MELIAFGPGEEIVRQGEVADAFYLVRMGHVKVFQAYGDGKGMVLSYLSRSQFFGEIGLLASWPTAAAPGSGRRTATCTALDHVELVRIGKHEFNDMIDAVPADPPAAPGRGRPAAGDRPRLPAQGRPRLTASSTSTRAFTRRRACSILDLEKCTRCDECVRACARPTTASPG